jgi:hypothetical protein
MNAALVGLILAIGYVLPPAATAQDAPHRWKSPGTASTRAEPIRPTATNPVSRSANGIYCPDMSEDAVGVHDLGWLPSGFNVAITVESYTENAFDPVAAVIVASVGQKAGGAVKVTTFYDNDSAGDKDAKVTFVTPQAGTYLLLVTDFPGQTGGCYRYQAEIG